MQERVYHSPVGDVSQLKQRLIDSWSSLSQDVIDDAIDQWQLASATPSVCEGQGRPL